MALHEQSVGRTDEWYTPPHVFGALNCSFDVDVASPGKIVTPWIPAEHFVTACSLGMRWDGFVWMNPPFGGRNGLVPWLEKFFAHRDGIALVPDRTSAPWWQEFAPQAELILFVSPKLKFLDASGKPGVGKDGRPSPAQGTCLLGIGERAKWALRRARSVGLGVLTQPLVAEHRPETK